MDITIKFKNELKCLVYADKSVMYGIKDKFSFYVNGYKFSPKYKYGNWDGKISLYNLATKEFYIGLIPDLFKWAKETGYSIGFDNDEDKRMFKPFLSFNRDTDNYFSEVVPNIAKFKPKDYQQKYIEEALTWNKLTIISPTGSGKSYIIYLIVRYILMYTDFRILITVPNVSLVEQLYSDFKDYTIDDWNVDNEVKRIYDKSPDEKVNKNPRIVISTWQSCKGKDQKFFDLFDSYMVDECFTKDSKVLTVGGYKNISELNVGDKIINYCETNKCFKEDEIVKVHKNLNKSKGAKVLKLTFDDGQIIECTEDHEFLTNNGWKKAKDLTEHDEIVNMLLK